MHEISGITAARLKRMHSIRRKLRRIGLNLSQLQDLGGCRAILPNMSSLGDLSDAIASQLRHEVRGIDDYITEPKADGYRSFHVKLGYRGREPGQAVHDGRRIEVQIRTEIQHSWATAVEAVGMFRGEDLKASRGSEDWLRLFLLMSAELAEVEDCAIPEGVPSTRKARKPEIRTLVRRLDAIRTLENLSYAIEATDFFVHPREKPSHFLLRYDNEENTVNVSFYFSPMNASASYDEAERRDNLMDGNTANVVLIEVDKLEHIREAYPNYFGDVQLFKGALKRIAQGKDVREYLLKPQEEAPVQQKERPDAEWFRKRKRWE